MVVVFYFEKTCLGSLKLQNPSDRQTLSNFEHVGFHVTFSFIF